jgi:tetratricopeptide (TPR) repeat protein
LDEETNLQQNSLMFESIVSLFLQNFRYLNQNTDSEVKIATLIKECQDLSIIVRCAEVDESFSQFCKQPILAKHWEGIWCTYGFILTEAKTPLYAHPNLCQFDLVRGIFFYHAARQQRNNATKNFTHAEVEFLKKSKAFFSIHGTKEYHQFLYMSLNQNEDDIENAEEIFDEIIKDNLNLVKAYGAYAYLMLAEAHYQYATWYFNRGEVNEAEKKYKSSITACDYADVCLEQSKYSVYNASFGSGLKTSNSFRIETPEEMKLFIIASKDKKLNQENNAFPPAFRM